MTGGAIITEPAASVGNGEGGLLAEGLLLRVPVLLEDNVAEAVAESVGVAIHDADAPNDNVAEDVAELDRSLTSRSPDFAPMHTPLTTASQQRPVAGSTTEFT